MQNRGVVAIGLALVGLAACTDGSERGPGWQPTSAGAGDGGDGDDGAVDDGDGGGTMGDDGDGDGAPADDGSSADDGHGDGDGNADDDGASGDVPELGATFTLIGTAANGLDVPRDLEFAPDHPDQLWTANTAFHGVVIFFAPGTPTQTSEVRADAYGAHFMASVSSIAFGANNEFSSCNESRDEWNGAPQPPDDFMGPTLWSADLDIFAVVGQDPFSGQEGCHLDMLHQSPLCMGIAHDAGGAYWAFDGLNGHIVHYDFKTDHGPGGSDHSDGIIRRYTEATISRVAGVPSHMEVDHESGLLYVADTGSGRIMTLDTRGGAFAGTLPGNWDAVDEYSEWTGAAWDVFATGLAAPSGLALHDGRVFVGDNATSQIVAFDLTGNELARIDTPAEGMMGLTIGPDGRLWYADGVANEVVRVDP